MVKKCRGVKIFSNQQTAKTDGTKLDFKSKHISSTDVDPAASAKQKSGKRKKGLRRTSAPVAQSSVGSSRAANIAKSWRTQALSTQLDAHVCSPNESLDLESTVRDLIHGRVGGEARLPSPSLAEESARASALERLRNAFEAICQKHGFVDQSTTGSFEKWHFQWLHEAGMQAIQRGRSAPEEPLLPFLAPASLNKLENMLKDDLVGKGLKGGSASAVAKELREATVAAIDRLQSVLPEAVPIEEDRVFVTPAVDSGSRVLQVCHGITVLRLNRTHYDKLRYFYARANSVADETSFHKALFCMLLRYKALLGGGTQAAIGSEVFAALRESFNVRLEGFASPLNCRYPSFCSAFPDTDESFGSLGSFFAFRPKSGSFELNPPFVDTLIAAMVSHITALLRVAEQQETSLTFAIIVGANGTSRQRKLMKLIGTGTFYQTSFMVKRNDHGYFEGEQHISKEPARLSPCDTFVFFWQSSRASEEFPTSAAALQRIKHGFTASCPSRTAARRKCIKQKKTKQRKVKTW